MSRLGFFGGSFNPITKAHVDLILEAIDKYSLDKVYFVPMNDKYKKQGLLPLELRKDMIEIALEDYPNKMDVFLIDNDKDFFTVIKHPQISTRKKKEIFINIFKDKIDEELLSFLLILIEKKRISHIRKKLDQMKEIYLEKHNTLEAVVKSAVPLLDEEVNQLKGKIETKYNKKIQMKLVVDKTLLGGLYVRVGDDVIDGTVKSKLDEMKEIMLKK